MLRLSLLASALLFAAPAFAQIDAKAASGVYAGSYTCTEGEHGFYLDIKSLKTNKAGGFDATGVLGFFPTLGGKGGSSATATGSFKVAGTISSKGEIAMTAGDWLKKPAAYGAANLSGVLAKQADGAYAIMGKPVVPGRPDMCTDLIATQFLPK